MCIKLLKMLVCLFNKTHIKLSKNADSAKVRLTVNLNSQYIRVKFITDLKSQQTQLLSHTKSMHFF